MFRHAMIIIFVFFSFLSSVCAEEGKKEAKYYMKLEDLRVQCLLCPRECLLSEGQTGTCTVRKNEDGTLRSLVYAQVCTTHVDPIEKKPLFHFLPGSSTYSLATAGCNLRCIFCQNWEISQVKPEEVMSRKLLPKEVVELAKKENTQSISYTYSEPTVFYEYVYDTALEARLAGLKNVMVTCGYINPEPLEQLCTVIDAADVDLKGFSDRVYRKIGGAKLAPLLETLKIMKQKGIWLEVGYLVIPTLNDSSKEMKAFSEWVAANLGKEVPVHFLRFFPMHKLTRLPPTPVETLERAYQIAKTAGLNYVYLGNVPGHQAENTYCPNCGRVVIQRKGYFVGEIHVKKGQCEFCSYKIAGVWE